MVSRFESEASRYYWRVEFDSRWLLVHERELSENTPDIIAKWKEAAPGLCRIIKKIVTTEQDLMFDQQNFWFAAAKTLHYTRSPVIFNQNTEQAAELRTTLKQLRQLPDDIFLKLQYLAALWMRAPASLKEGKGYNDIWPLFWEKLPIATRRDGSRVPVTDPKDRAWLIKAFVTSAPAIAWEDIPQLFEDLLLFKRIRADRRWKDEEANLDSYSAGQLHEKVKPYRPKDISLAEFRKLLGILKLPLDQRQTEKAAFLEELKLSWHVNQTRNRIRRALETAQFSAGDIEILYDGNEGMILEPQTETGSRIAGIFTDWCTAYENTGTAFDNYHMQGPLWVYILPNGEKFQMSLASAQFNDALDESVADVGDRASLEELGKLLSRLPDGSIQYALTLCPETEFGSFLIGLAQGAQVSPRFLQWTNKNLGQIAERYEQASLCFPAVLRTAMKDYYHFPLDQTAIDRSLLIAAEKVRHQSYDFLHFFKSLTSNQRSGLTVTPECVAGILQMIDSDNRGLLVNIVNLLEDRPSIHDVAAEGINSAVARGQHQIPGPIVQWAYSRSEDARLTAGAPVSMLSQLQL